MSLENLFSALAGRRCFVVCRVEPKPGGGTNKIPIDPLTGMNVSAHDPANWLTADEARATGLPIGIVIVEGSGLFCVDLDKCRTPTGWTQFAVDTCAKFPGACVEVSNSDEGIHIFGSYRGVIPAHRTRRNGQGMEVYSRLRFVMLTGKGMTGDILSDHTAALVQLLAENFPEELTPRGEEWTTEPNADWRGGGTDEQILEFLRDKPTARAAFGGGIKFSELFDGDGDALAQWFPPDSPGKHYNGSAADQALANHLAYATGYNCERTLTLMLRSGLRREKWEREDYLPRTILNAVAGKIVKRDTPPTPPPADDRTVGLITQPGGAVPTMAPALAPVSAAAAVSSPSSGNSSPEAGAAPIKWQVPAPPPPQNYVITQPQVMYHTIKQEDLFAGCNYVFDQDGILMPQGMVYSQRQFDAHYGGGEWQMNIDGSKPAKSAWDAFLYSVVTRFPRVDGLIFAPTMPSGEKFMRDGLMFLNYYVPLEIPRMKGDVSRWLKHVKTIYPNGNDAEIIICYCAAMVQNIGAKFTWALLLQGVEGNGKTYISETMEYCLGKRYTHNAKASELDSRFNSAFDGKLFIMIEDVQITEAKQAMWETLKPMITNKTLEIEGKGLNKVTRDVCFNFIMNSNHKDAIRKTRNDRRLAVFFAAQQQDSDLVRDGLTEEYFNELYDWSREGMGWAMVFDFLKEYKIPDKLNPTVGARRAPRTSSTDQALDIGLGSIEQEIGEAIEECRSGFREGWISSIAFDGLLDQLGKSKYLTRSKRHEVLEGMGYMLHPRLPLGRPLVTLSDGTRPKLYIPRMGHQSMALDPKLIGGAFIQAQQVRG